MIDGIPRSLGELEVGSVLLCVLAVSARILALSANQGYDPDV
jgi:hypothetical protein